MSMKPIPLSLEHKTLLLAGKTYQLSELVRKLYQVVVNGEAFNGLFDNSTEAKQCAEINDGEVVVIQVTSTPKKAFSDLWREHKKDIKAQGVYLTKDGEAFVITDMKPSRAEIIRSKGYGGSRRGFGEMSGSEKDSYFEALKDNWCDHHEEGDDVVQRENSKVDREFGL